MKLTIVDQEDRTDFFRGSYGNKIVFTILLLLIMTSGCAERPTKVANFGLVVHGGAGTILKSKMTPESEKEYRAILTEVLRAGYSILEKGGSSIDAVQVGIRIMENSPLFNAGKGAVFTSNEMNEMDASIMDGKTLNCGAAAGVSNVKNPIDLARLIMEKSPHVMLAGDGARIFAEENGLELKPDEYFFTERRWKQLQKARAKEKESEDEQSNIRLSEDHKYGTVGIAALDKSGNLAAGTSTGGMTNKRWGRIGDSPIIGAGTYANNKTCAVSCTGHGEYFMRGLVAYDVAALMDYKGMTLAKAADSVVTHKLTELGGSGGLIAIDRFGNIAMPFNTEGMYRGYMLEGDEPVVKIYKDEE